MPRGKNTNVYMVCQKNTGKDDKNPTKCGMQNYTTRINKKNFKEVEHKKYCPKCQTHTPHKTGSEIKHSS